MNAETVENPSEASVNDFRVGSRVLLDAGYGAPVKVKIVGIDGDGDVEYQVPNGDIWVAAATDIVEVLLY